MIKKIKYFGIIWLVGIALFHAITFLIPAEIFGVNRYEQPVFWVAYAFILLAYIGQLIAAMCFCGLETNEKKFLNIPVLVIGYWIIAATIVVSTIFMVFPVIQAWIGAIVCVILTAFFIVAIVKANVAATSVSEAGETVKQKTQFMQSMMVSVESIESRSNGDIKPLIHKVYEAIKYSDHVSSSQLEEIEHRIKDHIEELKDTVVEENSTKINEEVNELLVLIKERNSKCKIYK